MHASLIFCSTSASINVQKIFKIVLAKAFDLKCVIPEIEGAGEPVLIYVDVWCGWKLGWKIWVLYGIKGVGHNVITYPVSTLPLNSPLGSWQISRYWVWYNLEEYRCVASVPIDDDLMLKKLLHTHSSRSRSKIDIQKDVFGLCLLSASINHSTTISLPFTPQSHPRQHLLRLSLLYRTNLSE